MARRTSWEGHLRLSLVSCPVSLYKATQAGQEVHFNLLHRETLNRVKQSWRDAETGEEVSRSEMVRGFAIERDRYVVIEDEELAALKLESTRTIDIERFVDASSIDRLYWEDPYFVVPDGKPAVESFAVIREAMAGEAKVAIGRLVMSSRERIVAIEVRGRGMLLTTLRAAEEVRAESEYLDEIPDVKVAKPMLDIARQILAQSAGPFEPASFHDRYAAAVRELVEAKAAGAVLRAPSEPADTGNVVDLMEALRRSLQQAGAAARQPSNENPKPPKRAAPAKVKAPETKKELPKPAAKPAPRRRAAG